MPRRISAARRWNIIRAGRADDDYREPLCYVAIRVNKHQENCSPGR